MSLKEDEKQIIAEAAEVDYVGKVRDALSHLLLKVENMHQEINILLQINNKEMIEYLKLEHNDQERLKELKEILKEHDPKIMEQNDKLFYNYQGYSRFIYFLKEDLKPSFLAEDSFGKSKYAYFYTHTRTTALDCIILAEKLLQVISDLQGSPQAKKDKKIKKALENAFSNLQKIHKKVLSINNMMTKEYKGFEADLRYRRINNFFTKEEQAIVANRTKQVGWDAAEELVKHIWQKLSFERIIEGEERKLKRLFKELESLCTDSIKLIIRVQGTVQENKSLLDLIVRPRKSLK